MKKIYYIGFVQDKDILIVQAREDVDLLSPEIIHYFGHREITKKELKTQKSDILTLANSMYKNRFKRVKID